MWKSRASGIIGTGVPVTSGIRPRQWGRTNTSTRWRPANTLWNITYRDLRSSSGGAGKRCSKLGAASAPTRSILPAPGRRSRPWTFPRSRWSWPASVPPCSEWKSAFGFVRGMRNSSAASFRPEPYDLIYSFGVIHHTPNPDAVLEQLRKYSGPGTTVKIMVYHRRSWKVAWIVATEGKGRFWKLQDGVAKNSEA